MDRKSDGELLIEALGAAGTIVDLLVHFSDCIELTGYFDFDEVAAEFIRLRAEQEARS